MKRIKSILFVIVILIGFSFADNVFGWTAPTAIPPNSNVPTPLNISGTAQTKTGVLTVGGFDLSGNGDEGNISNLNIIKGYGDLFIWGDAAETAPIYLSGSKIEFYTGSTKRLEIDADGNLIMGTLSINNSSVIRANSDYLDLITDNGISNYINYDDGSDSFLVYSGLTPSVIFSVSSAGNVEIIGTLTVDGESITSGGLWQESGVDDEIYYNLGNVGVEIANPVSKLHVYQNDANDGAGSGVTIEQDGTGDAQLQLLLTGARRWVIGTDNSDSDKLKIGQGSNWVSGVSLAFDGSNHAYFGAYDVNFAGGTTYKIESDGDAALKDLSITTLNAGNSILRDGSSAYVFGSKFYSIYESFANDLRIDLNDDNNHGGVYIRSTLDGGSNYVDLFTIERDTGDVGIGTNDPSYDLDVVGNINLTGDLTIGGSAITTGYWSKSGDHVYYNDGNIGIGTTGPGTKLHVEGNLLVDAYGNGGADNGLFFREGYLTNAQPSITLKDHSGSAADGLSINAYDGISFTINTSEKMRIDSVGDVGIGNSDPGYKLDVSGTGHFSSRLTLNSASYQQHLLIQRLSSGFYLTQSSDSGLLEAVGSTDNFNFFGGVMKIETDGDVGIGTITPTVKLQVKEGFDSDGHDQIHDVIDISGKDAGAMWSRIGAGLTFSLAENNSNTPTKLAGIYVLENGFATSATGGGALGFYTKVTDGSVTQKMRIMGDGKVGIGVTAEAGPDVPFHVYSTDTAIAKFQGDDHLTVDFVGTSNSQVTTRYINGDITWMIGMDNVNTGITTDPDDYVIKRSNNGNVDFMIDKSTGNVKTIADLTVGGSITMETTTRYYSINPAAFTSSHPDADNVTMSGYAAESDDGVQNFYAPIQLPHGAIVTEAKLYGTGGDTWYLRRIDRAGNTVLMANGLLQNGDTTISYATVDNILYSYFVHANPISTDDKIRGGYIKYTITQPYP